MTEKRRNITSVIVSIFLAIFAYYLLPLCLYNFKNINGDGYLNLGYSIVVFLLSFLIFLFLPILPTLEEKELDSDTKYWKEREKKEQQYMYSILKVDNFISNYLPIMIKDLKAINIVFFNKYRYYSRGSQFSIFENFGTTNMKTSESIKELGDCIETLSAVCSNGLPTLLFINIGKEDANNHNVDKHLTALKQLNPNMRIIICCSSFYFDWKCQVIEELISKGIAQKEKVTECIFFKEENNRLLESIKLTLSN